MASLTDIQTDVAAETTLENSLITLLDGIQTQLAAALSSATIPPAAQAQIDSIFASLEANKTALTAALTANTPVAPAPAAPAPDASAPQQSQP